MRSGEPGNPLHSVSTEIILINTFMTTIMTLSRTISGVRTCLYRIVLVFLLISANMYKRCQTQQIINIQAGVYKRFREKTNVKKRYK